MTTSGAVELLRRGDELVTLRSVMLVGPHELAQLLGITRQHVHQLIKADDFPAPLAELAMGKVWDGHAVAAWYAGRTRRRRR